MTPLAQTEKDVAVLFQPFHTKTLSLANRIVMAPMTRSKSPGGVPGPDVAAYYRRRAEGGVGLIVTEGTYIAHPGAGPDPNVPRFYGDAPLAGWKRVVDQVHEAGGKIVPQLWHVGLATRAGERPHPYAVGPSGISSAREKLAEPMTQHDIDQVIAGYVESAQAAKRLGFDGLEIHGAHGYLIDQFFWEVTNRRTDRYGGDLAARTRFATEVIQAIRREAGDDFPIIFRFSQWKLFDYSVKLAHDPAELERFLTRLALAGVDIFHCSQRRFWEPEFEGSSLNLAGWTKKITGKPTITVGSVSLDQEFMSSFRSSEVASITGIDELIDRLERGEFDLVAIGRSLIVNPSWAALIKRGALQELRPFQRDVLAELL